MHPDTSLLEASTRLRVVSLLGEGGMGAVFLVEDPRTGRQLAAKVLAGRGADDLVRFKREFRVVAAVHHPNLVRLHGLFELADGRTAYTMELVRGRDLGAALGFDGARTTARRGPTPRRTPSGRGGDTKVDLPRGGSTTRRESPIEVVEGPPSPPSEDGALPGPACDLDALRTAVGQLLDALDQLHARGVVHRDLKPDNVLVEDGGRVVLLDFGIAEETTRGDDLDAGSLRGTLAYLAPELVRGGRAGPPADLYALGCLVHEALTGTPPFVGSDAVVVSGHVLETPAPLSLRVAGLDPRWSDLVAALLAKTPEARPTTDEVRARLGLVRATAAPLAAASLVGRDDELRELAGAARGPGARLVLVVGEAGLGKTAILDALFDASSAAGHLVLRGRCHEREAIPFRAVDSCIDALAVHLRGLPPEDLAPLRDDLAVCTGVFRALEMLGVEGARREGLGARDALFEAMRRVVGFVASRRPVVILVDDVGWADGGSVELLRALVGAGFPGELLVVATSRPSTSPEHPVAHLASSGRELTLSPLSDDAVRALVAARGAVPSPAVVAWAGGNPRFADELARAVVEHPDLARGDRPTLAALLDARLAGLGADARALVETAALLGVATPKELLEAASAIDDADRAFGEALQRGLLRAAEIGGAREGDRLGWEIAHDALLDRLVASMPEPVRRARRQALFALLERTPGVSAEARLHQALFLGDGRAIRAHATEAAKAAQARLAWERAAALYRLALDRLDEATPPLVRAELHLRASQTAHGLGDYPAVRAEIAGMLATMGVGVPRTPLRTAASVVALAARQVGRRWGLGRRAGEGEAPVLRAAAAAVERLAEIHATDDEPLSMAHAALLAVELAEASPTGPELARAHGYLGALLRAGRLPFARAYLARAEREADATGDGAARATVALLRAVLDASDGDLAGSKRASDLSARLYAEAGDVERSLHADACGLAAVRLAGDVAALDAGAQALLARAGRYGDPIRVSFSHLCLAFVASRRGDDGGVLRELAAADRALAGKQHGLLGNLASALAALSAVREGRDADAAALLAPLVGVHRRPGVAFVAAALFVAAEASRALAARSPEGVRLARGFELDLVVFSSVYAFARADLALQRAARAKTSDAERRALEVALAVARRFGMRHEAALAARRLSIIHPDPSVRRGHAAAAAAHETRAGSPR